MTLRRVLPAALAGMLAVALLGAPAPAARSKTRTHKVTAEGAFPRFTFEPPAIEIAVGDKVQWTNETSSEHHIQPYEGPWAGGEHLHLTPDGKAVFRFKKPGVYKYYCDLPYHGQLLPGGVCIGQCGQITVE